MSFKSMGNTGSSFFRKNASKKEETDSLDFLTDDKVTKVDANLFETPIQRIGVSGGTAAFYKLKYIKSNEKKTRDHYIGKDLLRALDEIEFYEDILMIQRTKNDDRIISSSLPELLNFTFEYIGVFSAVEAGQDGESLNDPDDPKNQRHLLVLRNLYDGCDKLRLLDFKIGQFTASSGWKKKSSFRATKQKVLDYLTNSVVEGYRLEGFDGSPESLSSRDETIETTLDMLTLKKKRRMMYQSMTGLEIFTYLMDVRDDVNHDLMGHFSAEEVSEIVLHEIVKRLAKLVVACSKITIPQKWVGSSVAVGFDSNFIPIRQKENDIRSKVILNIFDWGRSELNTPDNNDNLSPEEKVDRETFWKYYINGIYHLSYVAASTYQNRFGNSTEWTTLNLTIRDYDALSADEFLGDVTIPIKDAPLTAYQLKDGKKGKLSFSIEWQQYPSSSRFRGSWKIFIQQAKDLILGDLLSSDPYCVVTALSSDGKLCFEQTTKVIATTLNPVWEETFELPVMKSDCEFKNVLEEGGIKYSEALSSALENKVLCDRIKKKKKLKEFYGNILEPSLKQWENAVNGYS